MKHSMFNVVVLFGLSSLLVAQATKTSDPFYVIAHMINSQAAVDWALLQGANAIESDLRFDDNGNPTIIENGGICDCACAVFDDHVCRAVLRRRCAGAGANNNAAAHMQYVASKSGVALFYIDAKVEGEWGSRLDKAGAAVIPFIDNHLFNYGYKGKVLISASKVETFNYIQAAVKAANNSANRDRYFFTFDGENIDYRGVMAMLSRLTQNRVYSTGSSACSPVIYDSALKAGVNGRTLGENGLTIAWTIDLDSSVDKVIQLGVQGVMTNRVFSTRQRVNAMNLKLANSSSPIPTSTVNVASPSRCSCEHEDGGCFISWPAPTGKACKCQKILWGCVGLVVSCDASQPKCANPDASKEACQLGRGNCNGY